LKDLAIGGLKSGNEAHEKYQDNRAKPGRKKVGTKAQKFVKSFADFLGVYSGIVGLVKAGGGQYGELAYETLSILFIVSMSLVDRTRLADKIRL
jgi:hypothetical protein